jgi:hypothetical protein
MAACDVIKRRGIAFIAAIGILSLGVVCPDLSFVYAARDLKSDF